MKANIYVDGFNLYYGAVKGTPYRWLNIAAMCRLLLPRDQINQIKYFTALVSPRPGDPGQPARQRTYLRALRTIPNLTIILGRFLTHDVMMPLAPPAKGYVKVTKTEEKGSDVNLATHLLVDGYQGDYEIAIVVSNVSDLLAPIQVVTGQLKKPVGLLNPQKHPSRALLPHVLFIKQIRPGVLAKSQFPVTLTDARGSFSKPASW
ncbi:MAG TPA: NYN domain-containing protein [Anaerolineae bacterium]|nr:NYN domain-containing protein [Anaerolineae bacterium]